MSVERVAADGPLKGRRYISPPGANRMAIHQAVIFLGSGRSERVGPLLFAVHLDTGTWRSIPWTPAARLAVPEQYEVHFFTEG